MQANAKVMRSILSKKLILREIFDKSIFFYSIRSIDVNDLVRLDDVNTSHIEIIQEILLQNSTVKTPLSVWYPANCVFNITALLLHKDYVLDLIVLINEKIEEELHDYVREEYSINSVSIQIYKNELKKLRDEWRDYTPTEILDANNRSLTQNQEVKAVYTKINKQLLNLLI